MGNIGPYRFESLIVTLCKDIFLIVGTRQVSWVAFDLFKDEHITVAVPSSQSVAVEKFIVVTVHHGFGSCNRLREKFLRKCGVIIVIFLPCTFIESYS